MYRINLCRSTIGAFLTGNAAVVLLTAASLMGVLTPNAKSQAVAVAQVNGYVTDPSGQYVVGAQVRMIELDKQQVHVTSTDATGRYMLPDLPVGNYKLEVSSSGFKTFVQTGITLQVATNIALNVTMQIGSVTESIEVTANAAMVETKENTIGQVIDEHRLVDMPLNGRDPSQLLTLTGAGTNNMALNGNDLTGNKNMQGSNASRAFSVAGSQANGLSYLLDGGDNNDAFSNVNLPLPMPDAIQEFNVQTNALPAQYGLHPGGIVNIVTKSGGNDFHGDIFEFLRNGDLNARQKATPLRDSLKRNQFGGTAGGRIVRDKLFFFGGYQGTRQRTDPTNNNTYVPTAAALNGDFSTLEGAKSAGGCLASARALKNPFNSNAPFPNNQIPVSLFDPAAVKLVKSYIPTSTDPCGLIQYAVPANNPDDQWIARIDYQMTPKQSLYGRYFLYDFSQAAVFDGKNALPTGTPGLAQRSQTATIGHTYTISPRVVNSLHATFDRRRDDRGSASNLFSPKDLGVNMYQALPNYIQITVSSYFAVACGTCAPGYFNVNTYQLSDDLSIIRGKHQFAFGVDYRRDQLNIANFQQANGQFTFSGNSSGDGLADLMIGRIGTLANGNPNPDALRETVFALYAQDAFHATSRLSINYGIRWEPSLPSYDAFGRGNRFDMGLFQQGVHSTQYPAAPAGLVFANDGTNSYGKALTAAHWATFSPRVGLVWDVKGDGRQTVRAAFGLMHDTTELYYPERWTTNPPYASSISLTNVQFSNPYTGYVSPSGVAGDPFPGAAIFPSFGTYISIPGNVRPTYMMQWNLSYQRQIGKDWLLTANYLGNRTRHLWGSVDINAAQVIAGSTTSNDNQRRVLYLANATQGQYYGQIVQTDDGGRSAYNGLLLSLQHRFANHFTLLSNYTWAHCISDVEFLGELGNTVYQNSNDREHGERGNCTSDHRQIFNTSLSATSPGVGSGVGRKITTGWTVSPIVSLFTGQAITPTDGSKDVSLTGDLKDRPNVILPGSIYEYTTAAWFNPLAFDGPNKQTAGTFGNAGRYSIVGPGVISWDMAISREFVFKERTKLHVRADFFNILNHANWNNPTVDSSSGTFGQITTFSAPRIIQMAAKLYF